MRWDRCPVCRGGHQFLTRAVGALLSSLCPLCFVCPATARRPQTQAYKHPTKASHSSTAPERCFSSILSGGSIDLDGFHRAAVVTAALLAIGGVVSFLGIRNAPRA